jgi:perosamine synthetase
LGHFSSVKKKLIAKKFIPVNEPLLNGNEKKYINHCIDSGWISSEGPFVKEFEKKFSKRLGRKYGVAVTNGTAAVDAAVEALNIGPGDEVILPTFTIISCVLQIVRSGAKPVLVDSDPLTWNMDVNQIEKKITARTKAIMVVHIYGLPVDMDPVLKICKEYNLKLIEDAAEVIGQTYKGRPCGSFGDISTLSFYANKHITTGEGGMVLMNNKTLEKNCRELRNLCFKEKKRFKHERLGWNLRMTHIQAALGLAQLERLDEFIKKKRYIGAKYRKLLGNFPNIKHQLEKTDYAENIYWVYGIVLNKSLKFDADYIIKKLGRLGVGARPFFFPLHQQPILKKLGFFKNQKFPIAEMLSKKGFYIPSGIGIKDNQIKVVVDTLKKLLKY